MNLQLKTSAIKLLALLAVYSAACSSSEYEFGYSNNAAAGGPNWGMSSSVFGVPTMEGVDINGVIYQYTAVKDRADPYTVSIQNKDANNGGYIFRETDDWTGRSGATINKFVPVPYSPVGNWGDGSIETVGLGRVEDPVVVYSYRVSPVEPELPPMPDLPNIPIYDALSDPYVTAALEPTDLSLIDDDEGNKDEKEEEDDGRLETALAASENALTIGQGMSQAAMLQAMNTATNLNGYYAQTITGGTYSESVSLTDKDLPDNRRALRSLGQQKLHTDMVNKQYGR